MSLSVSTGANASFAIFSAAVPTHAPEPGCYQFMKDEPGEAVLVNIANSLDQPNSIRIASTPISDIFKNAPADPVDGQSTKGQSILFQTNEVWKVTDSVSGAVYYLPLSGHVVLKVPRDAAITGSLLSAFVSRLLGSVQRVENYDSVLLPLVNGVTRLPDTTNPG